MSEKYVFEEGMAEISGMGGGYEQACRDMLKAGLDYWDKHPKLNPKFREYEGIYGIISEDNKDAEVLSKVVVDVVGDCTGAMHQAVITSIFIIRKNGWKKYAEGMKEAKAKK